jgi:hypothetical protein
MVDFNPRTDRKQWLRKLMLCNNYCFSTGATGLSRLSRINFRHQKWRLIMFITRLCLGRSCSSHPLLTADFGMPVVLKDWTFAISPTEAGSMHGCASIWLSPDFVGGLHMYVAQHRHKALHFSASYLPAYASYPFLQIQRTNSLAALFATGRSSLLSKGSWS